ncbi:CARDB domain-containing protein, partial [Chloroflexota bacterium]
MKTSVVTGTSGLLAYRHLAGHGFSEYRSKKGVVKNSCQLMTPDEKVSLDITEETKLLVVQGKYLDSLSVEVVTSVPALPVGSSIIYAYDFGPDGATFYPFIILTMSYDPESLPNRIAENGLYITYWDGSQWLTPRSTVHTESNTVSAEISHFTQFALAGKLTPPPVPPSSQVHLPAPAIFIVSDLSVTPSEVESSDQVTVSAQVTNAGGSEGSYIVILNINSVEEARQEVTLGAGKNETVKFTIAKDTCGSYTVNIDGEVAQFAVIVPPILKPPLPPTEALPVQPPTNRLLIGGIILGCVALAIGLLSYFFIWRKRGKLKSS